VFFRCDSAGQAIEVVAAILGLQSHPGATVLAVEGCAFRSKVITDSGGR